jgi:hypothetical protein
VMPVGGGTGSGTQEWEWLTMSLWRHSRLPTSSMPGYTTWCQWRSILRVGN